MLINFLIIVIRREVSRREAIKDMLRTALTTAVLEWTATSIWTDSRRFPVQIEQTEDIFILPLRSKEITVGLDKVKIKNKVQFGNLAGIVNPSSLCACSRALRFSWEGYKTMEIGGCGLDLGLDGRPGKIGVPVDVAGDHSIDPTASLVFRMRMSQLFMEYAKGNTMGKDDLQCSNA